MPELEKLLKQYDYTLPKELIAQSPSRPRDSARLMVFIRSKNKVAFDRFYNIGKYLPKNSVLVFNQTKVIPARLALKKATGGKIEVLYVSDDGKTVKVLSNKKLLPGSSLSLSAKLQLKVFKKKDQFYFLKPNFPVSKIKTIMEKYGRTPLPPYMKNSPLTEAQRRREYQSIFAKQGLSVAAPTASLHFTRQLVAKLKKQGIEVKFVTLNVNLGTFAPLTQEHLKSGKLHSETYEVDEKTAQDLNKFKKEGRPIIAVGTTVIRTLESAAKNHLLKRLKGDTRLFIQPGYKFQFVDGAITNFHVPKSSLLMLVSTIIGRPKLMNLYKQAIKKRLRFFSFGDGMLILK